MIDFTEKLKQGRLAALHVAVWGIVLSIFVAAAVGLFFAESDDALLRRAHFAVAALGIAFTGVIVYRILTQDITEHHYRERLKAEKEAERAEAEIAEANARAALYRAKERAIFTPLPGRVAPALPERTERTTYDNDEEIVEEPPSHKWHFVARDEPEASAQVEDEPAPAVSARGQTIITESADAYNVRMVKLANRIYDVCRDVNPPTQADIIERIPRTAGGLLRSNNDITQALNILARRGLIEHEKGQGITRLWLDGRGVPLPKTPKPKRGAIASNVRVERA